MANSGTRAPLRDPRRAYQVVDLFEQELCDYTGAPYAVTVDSCTNALLLSLVYWRTHLAARFPFLPPLSLPRHTYVGVLQAAVNAGWGVRWRSKPDRWQDDGFYSIDPTTVWDWARRLPSRDEYPYEPETLSCVSFHAAKQLPLGRGGAILTDNALAADWLRAARMDGRPPGAPLAATRFPGFHCPLPPDTAARGLWTLARWNDSGYTPPPLPVEEYPDLSTLKLP